MQLLLGWFLRNPLSQILKATISNFHTPQPIDFSAPNSNSTQQKPSFCGVEMDIEQKQEELIDHFVKQASSLSGSALASVVAEATSHPSLFAFSEILSVPNVLQHLSNKRADLEINEELCAHVSFLSKIWRWSLVPERNR